MMRRLGEFAMSGFLRFILTAIFVPFRLPAVSRSVNSFRDQLHFGLAATFVPPAGVAALYLYGSSTGCSGGDCTGAMILVGLLGLLAIPISIGGLIWVAVVSIGEWVRRLRLRRPAD